MTLRVFSYGGGVQSTAALVLAANGEIDYRIFAFSNVGDDSEHPASLRYVREIAMPYAEQHGIELVELRRQRRDGTTESLLERMDRTESSISIPVRMQNGAPGNRTCTMVFKIRVIDRFLRERGATKTDPAVIGLGISLDELTRMRSDSGSPYKTLDYPLIDRRIDRAACIGIIERSGLPVPQKSSCYFCPFHRIATWQKMRHDEPELFWKSVELERKLNERRARLGKDQVWLTDRGRPLDEVTSDNKQLDLFSDDREGGCNSAGFCFV